MSFRLGMPWTPIVCNRMAFMVVIMGFALLVYLLLGSLRSCVAYRIQIVCLAGVGSVQHKCAAAAC